MHSLASHVPKLSAICWTARQRAMEHICFSCSRLQVCGYPPRTATVTVASKARGYILQESSRYGLSTWRWTIASRHTTCALQSTKIWIILDKGKITVPCDLSLSFHLNVASSLGQGSLSMRWHLQTPPTESRLKASSILLQEYRGL